MLKALDTSTEMATLPGSEQLRENHCRATCTMASHPLGVLTPSCRGLKISRVRSVIKSTATLLVSRRTVSPIGIGLKDPLGLRRAMMEAPRTYGRSSSGTSPPEQEADHLREKPKKQVGRSRAQRIADVRRTEAGPARTRSRRERHESLANLVHIRRGGRTRRNPPKSAHLQAIFNGRAGVKEAERSNDVIRGTDRGVLQKRRTSPTESTFLFELSPWRRPMRARCQNHHPGPDCHGLCSTGPAKGPEVSPNATQTTAPGLSFLLENMLPASAGGSRKDQRRKSQKVGPRLDITMSDHIRQGSDETPGPGVLGTLVDRRTDPPVTGENFPHTKSPLSQWASRIRDPFLLGREGAETGRATTVETETQYSLAHLAGAKPLPAKPVHRDVTEELPREVSIDVGAHGAEGGPPVRGASVIGAGGDRTEEPGAG